MKGFQYIFQRCISLGMQNLSSWRQPFPYVFIEIQVNYVLIPLIDQARNVLLPPLLGQQLLLHAYAISLNTGLS